MMHGFLTTPFKLPTMTSKLFERSDSYLLSRWFWSRTARKEKEEEKCVDKEDVLPRPTSYESCQIPHSWSQPKVVVIGAGIAGLSAAQRLVQCGICDITVLEATDRPGGRIQSCWFTNSVAELGAHSIQGACAANSVYNLAVKENLLTSPLLRTSKPPGVFYLNRGKPISSNISQAACAEFRHIESLAMSLYGSDVQEEQSNMYKFMSSRIKKEVKNFPESERSQALAVMNNYLDALKEKSGSSLECVNTKYYGSKPSLPGGSVKIPVGFVGVLAPLIRDIPDCTIQYCKPVVCVKWDVCESDKPKACVQCAEGESYPADYVIVTTPLGFLKDKAEAFFVPNLPSKKMKAINTLGFGHLNHLFLQFAEPIWAKDESDIRLAWNPDDYEKCDSWIKGLTSLNIEGESGKVLSASIAGQEAITMETLDADQIMEDVQKLMQSFLSNPSIPKPSSILRSKWSTNVYSQGALTFISTESGTGQVKDLAEPIPDLDKSETPVLLFAGEHTSTQSYATVHGARESGIREANRLLNYTKLLKGAPAILSG